MSKTGLVAMAAQFIPRLRQVRLGTWLTLTAAIVLALGLLMWATVSIIGWLLGQAQALSGNAPGAAQAVIAQVEQAMPGVREKLGEFVPALKPEPPPRDVSGTDIGPVARYPGLARSLWHREGQQATVRYEGPADYAAVLEHYARGFSAQGYAQNVLSASSGNEQHEYLKGNDRVGFEIAQLPEGKLQISVVAVLPVPTFGKPPP